MKRSSFSPKQIGIMAMFVSIGLILQYVESRILISPVPGGKLGLANVVSILNIFMFGSGNAMLVALLRAFLGALITGGVMAVPYSLAGTFFSMLVMCFLKKYFYPKVSMVGMSILAAAVHNLSQVCVAALILWSPYIFSYLPLLLTVSAISGTATGYAAQVFGNRILKYGDEK